MKHSLVFIGFAIFAGGCSYSMKYKQVPYRAIPKLNLPKNITFIETDDARTTIRDMRIGNIRVYLRCARGKCNTTQDKRLKIIMPDNIRMEAYIDKRIKEWFIKSGVNVKFSDNPNLLTHGKNGFVAQIEIKDLRYHSIFEADYNIRIVKDGNLLVDRDGIALGYEFNGSFFRYKRLPDSSYKNAPDAAFGFMVRDLCERTAMLISKAKTLSEKEKK